MGVHVSGGVTTDDPTNAVVILKCKDTDVAAVVANIGTANTLYYAVEGAAGPADTAEHWDFSVATVIATGTAAAGAAAVENLYAPQVNNIRVSVNSDTPGASAYYRVHGESDGTQERWEDH